jgi:hypothetical protein
MSKLNRKQWTELKKSLDEGERIADMTRKYGISRNAIYLYGNRHWGWNQHSFFKKLWKLIKFLYKKND